MNWSKVLFNVAVYGILVMFGFWLGSLKSSEVKNENVASSDIVKEEIWTCSMHPQIKLPKQGKCPICFMDLIPLEGSSQNEEGERVLKMSKAAMKLAEVETRLVERKAASVRVNLVGKVVVDTTRISDIPLLVDGEIRRLFVNYIGIPVKAGDHLAELYSPDVYVAGKDLLAAVNNKVSNVDFIRSAVTKLKLLGVPQDYIDHIQKERIVQETYILKSPFDGYVENLIGYQGMWVKKGQMLCRVVDMSSLWVNLDAYESDLSWIRYGQNVVIRTEALLGQTFDGTVSYIPPRLDDQSRTVKVRINVDNKRNLLKPGMFVSAELMAKVKASGQAVRYNLMGKWISPMHPEIVKDKPGNCDVCGMKLVKAEELGLGKEEEYENPLLVPSSAVLITGKRAVVYIKKEDLSPTFEGREVELGPKVGMHYVVLSGVKEGERVVVKGNFKIDSALQILAKPSMMSMPNEESSLHSSSSKTLLLNNVFNKEIVTGLLGIYMKIHDKLVRDEFVGLNEMSREMLASLELQSNGSLAESELKLLEKVRSLLKPKLESMNQRKHIKSYREEYKTLSNTMLELVRHLGHQSSVLYLMHCPMADASWLQVTDLVANPYYGSSMLRCGELKQELGKEPEQH